MQVQKKDIRLVLKNLAKNYNLKRKIPHSILENILVDISLNIKPGISKVLDLGCGSGRILTPLAHMFQENRFVGTDLSEDMLAEFSQPVAENIELMQSDFNDPVWPEKIGSKYDLVLFFQSVHFVKNVFEFVLNVKKIMSTEGVIMIASTTHSQFYTLPYCTALTRVLQLELARTPDEFFMTEIMKKSGFKLLSRVEIGYSKKFKTKHELREWLLSKPFSVLNYLTEEEYAKWVESFLKKHSGKVLLDKFSILTYVLN